MNRKLLLIAIVLLVIPAWVTAVTPFERGFTKITPVNGFGEDQNNYAWGMTEYGDCIYVGTSRNVPYYVGLQLKLGGLIPWDLEIPDISHPAGSPPPPFGPGNPYTPNPADTVTWSNDMSGQVWRYCGASWEKVHTAPTFMIGPYTYPEGTGYRYMITYTDKNDDEAVYAGVGTGFGNTLVWKSETGNPGDWCKVKFSHSSTPYDTRAMAIHNGDLYVGLGLGSGGVFRTDDPNCDTDTWVDTHFPGAPIGAMKSYNGLIYVTTWGGDEGAFEVWRSTKPDPVVAGDWVRVVSGGAGDAYNSFGADIEEFNGNLYVGSMSLPITQNPDGTGGLRMPKGFDLIRLDKDDNWDLIIGDYVIPPERQTGSTSERGLPMSGWPSGFGNPFNFYNWQLEEHNGLFYLTTFDASSFLRIINDIDLGDLDLSTIDQSLINTRISELQSSGIDDAYTAQLLQALQQQNIGDILEMLGTSFGGADMWVSSDGIHWVPVELNGLNNPNNYGFRTLLSTEDGLYVGTANPFQGCEVWLGKAQTGASLVTTTEGCLFDVDTKQQGQQFKLIFTPDVPDNPSKYRLTASNPGQFRYNAFFIGQLDEGEDFTLQLPYPFVTQGANPVHVYSALKLGENKCLIPGKDITSQFSITGVPVALGTGYNTFGQFATITVESNDEYSGFVWIVVHGDYGLKKSIGNLGKDANNNAVPTIFNDYKYTFKVKAPFTGQSIIENLNVFKRDPGFVGLVTDSFGNPVKDVQVEIWGPTGTKLGAVSTDKDGWYAYNYKYTGKASTFSLKLPAYNMKQSVIMKSNTLIKTDFTLP
jgi:hypothetical protein